MQPLMKSILRSFKIKSSLESLEARIAPATITVTTLADAGAGSLREAINTANGDAASDTIVFDSSIAGGTIHLSTGELHITSPMIIKGNSQITIDADASSRIFNIDDTTSTVHNVQLSGLNLIDGKSTRGGAIFSEENLTLTKVTISGNEATVSGGGIYSNIEGSLTISKSSIFGNKVTGNGHYGGGIAMYGTNNTSFSMTNTVVANNSSDSYGGGMFIDAPVIKITSGTITGNAGSYGGGAYLTNNSGDKNVLGTAANKGTVTISKTTFSGNHTTRGGAGMYLASYATKINITKSIFTGNSADDGAGAFCLDTQGGNGFVPVITIKNCSVTGNTAGDIGGGILFYGDSSLPVVNLIATVVSGNRSADNGGGIWIQDSVKFTMQGGSVTENYANGSGGGIFLDSPMDPGAFAKLKGVKVFNNSAEDLSTANLSGF